jgi:hypothetical protein
VKKGKVILLTVVVFSLLAFFVGQYISNSIQERRATRIFISHVYVDVMRISLHLDSLIDNVESGVTSVEDNLVELSMLSNGFVRFDSLLSQYGWSFPNSGLRYGALPSFDCVSSTIIGYGAMMGNSISAGDVISEDGLIYLKSLRDDINHLLAEISCDDNPLQVRESLTISQLNVIIDEFFESWRF